MTSDLPSRGLDVGHSHNKTSSWELHGRSSTVLQNPNIPLSNSALLRLSRQAILSRPRSYFTRNCTGCIIQSVAVMWPRKNIMKAIAAHF